jgi:DNA-binding CsgD family transcriptional regulator
VDLLGLQTGWIWLMQDDQSVYLAASYNLPPALKEHPERLSGRCYCIEKYLSDNIDKATNISEVVCTRLHNLRSGTNDLKFHATIPINTGHHKVGLINILSKESQQLNKVQLCFLSTVSELIGIFIQRTRVQDNTTYLLSTASPFYEVLRRVFPSKLESIINELQAARHQLQKKETTSSIKTLNIALQQAEELYSHLTHILVELEHPPAKTEAPSFRFPASPLTERELEILALVKKGYTNKQIGETIFLAERTIKFHLTSILSKLSASTRTEAVDIAAKRGLIGF